jgi:DNA recombination protein RmuC
VSSLSYLAIGLGGGLVAAAIFAWFRSRRPSDLTLANTRTAEDELRDQIKRREDDLARVRVDLAAANQRNGELTARFEVANEALATERRQIEKLQEDFHKEFKRISNQQLIDNRSEFGKQSSESLETLLKPLRDELKDFKAKLENTQLETANYNAELKSEVSNIETDTTNLATDIKENAKMLRK